MPDITKINHWFTENSLKRRRVVKGMAALPVLFMTHLIPQSFKPPLKASKPSPDRGSSENFNELMQATGFAYHFDQGFEDYIHLIMRPFKEKHGADHPLFPQLDRALAKIIAESRQSFNNKFRHLTPEQIKSFLKILETPEGQELRDFFVDGKNYIREERTKMSMLVDAFIKKLDAFDTGSKTQDVEIQST